jgi:hypothetical protein
LQDTTTTRDADTAYLEDLTATCAQKSSDFESRQQLRAEEIEAIEKAIEIISSGAVAGSAEEHLPQFVQKNAFAQLRAESNNNEAALAKVAAFFRRRATPSAATSLPSSPPRQARILSSRSSR